MNTNLQYQRRAWIKQVAMAALASMFTPGVSFATELQRGFTLLLADVVAGYRNVLPKDKSIPFDWPFAEVPASGSTGLAMRWKNIPKKNVAGVYFRITSATDMREEVEVNIVLATSQIVIGKIVMNYAHYFQPFEVLILPEHVAAVANEGIHLIKVKGQNPLWIFIKRHTDIPEVYSPHLLLADTKSETNVWQKRLLSIDSLQTFGWMEGCVLDGIYDLCKKEKKTKTVFNQHLDKFFNETDFFYETYANLRVKNQINNVESLLPFAMLAKAHPNHPAIKIAIEYCRANADANGNVSDEKAGRRIYKTEECYTVSYPLALLGNQFKNAELLKLSVATLKARYHLLLDADGIYQNGYDSTNRVYKNWGRGVAWLLLGSVKTIPLLPEGEDKELLKTELKKVADLVIGMQRKNGLWYCFMDDAASGFETSGSAGIAAAFAAGYNSGLLDKNANIAVHSAWTGLQQYITADGLLTATAQVNKGGEALQRNGFRVISPYTLGFLGIMYSNL